MKTNLVDANIVIRYLTKDDPNLFIKAKQYFIDAASGKSKIYLDSVTVAEIVWVLTSFYRYPRINISEPLLKILSQQWVLSDRKSIIISALTFFATHNFSYIDCYLYCLAKTKDLSLITFDKKLSKI